MITARRRLLVLAVLGTLFWAAGCLSPTLPLPPPGEPTITAPDEAGYVTLTGSVPPRAEAVAHNIRTDKTFGDLTDETGSYEIVMPAEIGDEIRVYYRLYARQNDSPRESEWVTVVVPEL
jgi:hypothetical protein